MENTPTQKTNYFGWLAHQLKGWGGPNYGLFFFALGFQLALLVTQPLSPISVVTFFGTMIGVACIIAINAVRPINGVLGIISAILLIYVGFTAKNYLSMLEQAAYVLTLDLPVLLGKNKWTDKSVNEIKKFGVKEWVFSILFTVAIFLVSSFAIQAMTNEPRPFVDGLSFAICLTAGIICWLKYNNQYFWWLAAGLIQVILWGLTAAQGNASIAMLVSSLIYVANDVIAFTYSPWFHKKNRSVEAEAK